MMAFLSVWRRGSPPSLRNRGKSGGKEYECDLEFLRSVKSEVGCRIATRSRGSQPAMAA
jgi:hypothetical protein